MSKIQASAKMKIPPGMLEEFKRQVAEISNKYCPNGRDRKKLRPCNNHRWNGQSYFMENNMDHDKVKRIIDFDLILNH